MKETLLIGKRVLVKTKDNYYNRYVRAVDDIGIFLSEHDTNCNNSTTPCIFIPWHWIVEITIR